MATSSQYGSFVPTNFIWEIQELQRIDVTSPEFKELLVRLYQNIGLMALVLNDKDTGLYPTAETVNNQQFFPNPANSSATTAKASLRQVLRKVIYYTTGLPNNGTVTIAHGIIITAATTFTRIYGVTNDPTNMVYHPLPSAAPLDATNIKMYVSGANVIITTGSNRTSFTKTYIVLEYLQS